MAFDSGTQLLVPILNRDLCGFANSVPTSAGLHSHRCGLTARPFEKNIALVSSIVPFFCVVRLFSEYQGIAFLLECGVKKKSTLSHLHTCYSCC